MAKRKQSKTEYTVTRIAYGSEACDDAIQLAEVLGKLRKAVWDKFGSLQAWGVKQTQIVKTIRNTPSLRSKYGAEAFGLSSEIWERTVLSVVDDIHACQEAAKVEVVRKVYKTFGVPETTGKGKQKQQVHPDEPNYRKLLCGSLDDGSFADYPLLHRWVRQAYQRGRTHCSNQIVINGTCSTMRGRITRHGVFTHIQVPGFMLGKRCQWFTMTFKTGRVRPKAGRMRIIIRDGHTELHYPRTETIVVNSSTAAIGADKGYSEAFYDSDGNAYGRELGRNISKYSDRRSAKGRKRQKLWALTRNKPAKAANILANNLGYKTEGKRVNKENLHLQNIIKRSTNELYAEVGKVVTEDLSDPIKSKGAHKAWNRRLSNWYKGEIQESLEVASQRQGKQLVLVNCAYSSQVDSRNGTLLGKRSETNKDRFFTFDGVELHADDNAAKNLLYRENDPLITRYRKFDEVHFILMIRTERFLAGMGYTLEQAVDMGWLQKRHLTRMKAFKSKNPNARAALGVMSASSSDPRPSAKSA